MNQNLKRTVKSRVLRSVLSSLLSSNLTDRELIDFAEEIDSEFTYNLREAILRLPLQPRYDRVVHSSHPVDDDENHDHPLIPVAYDIAKKKRLSKEFLLAAMSRINPLAAESIPRNTTVRSVLSLFLMRSSHCLLYTSPSPRDS